MSGVLESAVSAVKDVPRVMTVTTPAALAEAHWISKAVPAAQRIIRATRRNRIRWVAPGLTLTQTFHTDGPVHAVNIDLAGPGGGVERGVGGWRIDIVVPTGARAHLRVPGNDRRLTPGTHSLVLPSPSAHDTPELWE